MICEAGRAGLKFNQTTLRRCLGSNERSVTNGSLSDEGDHIIYSVVPSHKLRETWYRIARECNKSQEPQSLLASVKELVTNWVSSITFAVEVFAPSLYWRAIPPGSAVHRTVFHKIEKKVDYAPNNLLRPDTQGGIDTQWPAYRVRYRGDPVRECCILES